MRQQTTLFNHRDSWPSLHFSFRDSFLLFQGISCTRALQVRESMGINGQPEPVEKAVKKNFPREALERKIHARQICGPTTENHFHEECRNASPQNVAAVTVRFLFNCCLINWKNRKVISYARSQGKFYSQKAVTFEIYSNTFTNINPTQNRKCFISKCCIQLFKLFIRPG